MKSADLNAIQDCIIAGKHGDVVTVVSAIEGMDIGASGTFTDSPVYWKSGTAPDALTIPLPLKVGDRLKQIVYKHWSGGAGSKTFSVYKQTAAGAFTLIGATWDTTLDPADGSVVSTTQNGTDYTVAAGEKLFVRYVSSNVDDRFYQMEVTWDRP